MPKQYFIGEPQFIAHPWDGGLFGQIIGTFETGRKSSHTVYAVSAADFAPNGYYEKWIARPHKVTIIRITEQEWSEINA